jgi:chloride channel 3/4/5
MPAAVGTTGPSEPSTRRRERIGSSTTIGQTPDNLSNTSPDASPTEHTTLNPKVRASSYGTLPATRRRKLFNKPSLNIPTGQLFSLPSPTFLRSSRAISSPSTPASTFPDTTFSRLSTQRPISSYDAPLHHIDGAQTDTDARINGIRVWYLSFSSVDWLHDAIKDSARFARLRRGTSVRDRVRLIIDKSLGWFVVTIVGVLTAVLAFLIVRTELWLFDTKDGYCRNAWWKAKRFCCPRFSGIHQIPGTTTDTYMQEDDCFDWRTWADVVSQTKGSVGEDIVTYISYALIAVRFVSFLERASFSSFSILILLGHACFHVISPYHLSHELQYIQHSQGL